MFCLWFSDCGAGIGRVTKGLLLPVFNEVSIQAPQKPSRLNSQKHLHLLTSPFLQRRTYLSKVPKPCCSQGSKVLGPQPQASIGHCRLWFRGSLCSRIATVHHFRVAFPCPLPSLSRRPSLLLVALCSPFLPLFPPLAYPCFSPCFSAPLPCRLPPFPFLPFPRFPFFLCPRLT